MIVRIVYDGKVKQAHFLKGVIISHDYRNHWGGLWDLLKEYPDLPV